MYVHLDQYIHIQCFVYDDLNSDRKSCVCTQFYIWVAVGFCELYCHITETESITVTMVEQNVMKNQKSYQ